MVLGDMCSLPRRQLRNYGSLAHELFYRSLPRRQLRKVMPENLGDLIRSLPRRQLRKLCQFLSMIKPLFTAT